MKVITLLFKHSWRLVTIASIAGFVSGLSAVGLISIINSTLGGGGFTGNTVIYYAAIALFLVIMRIVCSTLLSYLAQNAVLELRMQLSRRILAAPLRQLEEIGPHRMLALLTNDVNSISGGILIVQNLLLQGALLIGCTVYLAWLSWSVFLVVFIFIVGATAIYHLATKRAYKFIYYARELQDALFKHFGALTEGTKELKLHRMRREAFLDKSLLPTATALRRTNIIGNAIFIVAGSGGQLLVYVLMGLLLFAIPAVRHIDTNVLIGFVFTISYVVAPIEAITAMLPGLSNANASMQKVEALGLTLMAKEANDNTPEAPLQPQRWNSLELVGVTHTYRRERESSLFTVGPLDLRFQPGSLTFITGGNGSGKTTLAKLLTGLYAPESGEVRLDGEAVTEENRDAYRQYFSAVFSDFYLFDNLLGLDVPELDEQAHGYLNRLQLEHKVEVRDGALSTIELSQGQRKRLALLTAYIEDRPIYLFDEWAADQDPLFKELFYLELLPELKAKGKTVFVISHDDKYYGGADQILKLEDGRIEQNPSFPQSYAISEDVLVN